LERDLMVKNNCQFVVQVKSTFQDEDYLYFAMEYVQGGDLLHLLIDRDKLSEE
jgi:serine/threonine kinase 38